MYYEFIVVEIDVFTNLFLVIVTMLTKLTCLRTFFICNIFRHLFVYFKNIIFQSFWTILLLYISEISVFTNSSCVFAILSIFVLNLSTPKVQKYLCNNTLLKCEKILNILYLHSLYLLFGSPIHFSFLCFIP